MIRRFWRGRSAVSAASDKRTEDAPQAETASAILRLLDHTATDGRVYQIRDLDGATGLLQRDILRAVEELRRQEKITLDGGQFDPLSAVIRAA